MVNTDLAVITYVLLQLLHCNFVLLFSVSFCQSSSAVTVSSVQGIAMNFQQILVCTLGAIILHSSVSSSARALHPVILSVFKMCDNPVNAR